MFKHVEIITHLKIVILGGIIITLYSENKLNVDNKMFEINKILKVNNKLTYLNLRKIYFIAIVILKMK